MRNAQKREVLECIESLYQAHEEVREALRKNDGNLAQTMLGECQEFAVNLGESIEQLEGEGHVTVSHLEKYCETLFHVFEEIGQGESNGDKICKTLRKQLIRVENSVKHDIRVRKEIVFFPYKASMWDSLESVYLAAKEDPGCDVYCVPIPYYDRNPDGSFGQMHYEGASYPDYVEVTDWQSYNLEERKPDAAYIHNPYDEWNHVTSVHPRYYSKYLKQYADILVYIPYYATTGVMSEAQDLCPAYVYADYIVIQSPKMKDFFDKVIPAGKFLPFGSPKFDSVIRKCQNPPEPPEEWKAYMQGRKVYFYNTSINGMLANTDKFLKKMRYVFDTFKGREDACLLWRPHPLLESTFDSMRASYKAQFDALKREFVEQNIGILDETPDIESTIALSDAYIGDSGTSVTSLFGIVGKPVFLLNNGIHSEPERDDWRGAIIQGVSGDFNQNRWVITQGNKLYHSSDNDFHYSYCCDLSPYAYGGYYSNAIEKDGKVYVCPMNAQEILVMEEGKIEKRIPLKKLCKALGSFRGAAIFENYIFLSPGNYPYIVKYDTVGGNIEYIDSHREIWQADVNGKKRWGGACFVNRRVMLASPVNDTVVSIDIDDSTAPAQILHTKAALTGGCMSMISDPNQEDLWILPYEGNAIAKWNPETGELKEYSGLPDGFTCTNRIFGYECMEHPFSGVACEGDYVYLSPGWGNMFIRMERSTGCMEEWIPPFPVPTEARSGYYGEGIRGIFLTNADGEGGSIRYYYHSYYDRKLYEVRLGEGTSREIPIVYDRDELEAHEPGFCEQSEWFPYAANENAFNSLGDFLDGTIVGAAFDKEKQLQAFEVVTANHDGTCGESVHRFVADKLSSGGTTV